MSTRDHALRVAVLAALLDVVKAEYQSARQDAETEFAIARADGQKQQAVLLPDGSDIGLIAIKAGSKTVDVTEEKLLGWVEEHLPDGLEEEILPSFLSDPEVIGMVRDCFPGSTRKTIRPATRSAILKELEESGGLAVDKANGDVEKLGDVTEHAPTGAFSYRPGKAARDRIVAEWQAGTLRHVVSESLEAVPVPEAVPPSALLPAGLDDAAVAASFRSPPFADENGFLDPQKAAAHAITVQGGFTTPPIEAYRMVRDGGAGRERALAWMEKFGLDPQDPREGKDTPWPLAEVAA